MLPCAGVVDKFRTTEGELRAHLSQMSRLCDYLVDATVRAAERYAKEYGVEFLYRDFRPNFRAGNQKARELGFYMQKYCGCVFSEQDRYQKQINRDLAKFAEAKE